MDSKLLHFDSNSLKFGPWDPIHSKLALVLAVSHSHRLLRAVGIYGITVVSGDNLDPFHYNDVIMSAMASQITSLSHLCSLNRLFSRRSKKTSKLRVTGLCARNSPVTGEFPIQIASNAENISIWWRHHAAPDHQLTSPQSRIICFTEERATRIGIIRIYNHDFVCLVA